MRRVLQAPDGRSFVAAERTPLWHPPVAVMTWLRAAAAPADIVLQEAGSGIVSGHRFLAVPPYPGWTAWADGEPLEIYPAEGLGMVFEVPVATRSLEVRFIPWTFFGGLLVTLCTGVLMAGIGWKSYRRVPASL